MLRLCVETCNSLGYCGEEAESLIHVVAFQSGKTMKHPLAMSSSDSDASEEEDFPRVIAI